MFESLRCSLFGHDWQEAFVYRHWWLCSRCQKNQFEYASSTGAELANYPPGERR
jgi:hypothetical protein